MDADFRLVGGSREFHHSLGTGEEALRVSLGNLDAGHVSNLKEMMQTAVAGGEAYATVLPSEDLRQGRNVVLIPVYPPEAANERRLLVIEDTTERTRLLRQLTERVESTELLIEEMRHRIANSLQIIASVVRIKAHLLQSEEARGHLEDVHRRVLAIAELQEELDAPESPQLRSVPQYLKAVCSRLAHSIADPRDQVDLQVEADDFTARAETCVSMGLVVTELVINALKHAFRDTANRIIRVVFAVHGSGWQLSVADNGVGCDLDSADRTTGVGTRIVNTLARRLGCRVELSHSEPHGLTVTLSCDPEDPSAA